MKIIRYVIVPDVDGNLNLERRTNKTRMCVECVHEMTRRRMRMVDGRIFAKISHTFFYCYRIATFFYLLSELIYTWNKMLKVFCT